MNRTFLLCLLSFLLIGMVKSQTVWSDDFSDGNFNVNPAWSGRASDFVINSSNELQSNADPDSSTTFLQTTSSAINNVEWKFYFKLEFSPSTSNYAKVYLAADSANLLGSLQAYYVRLGGASGTIDDVSLYRQDGVSSTKIIDGIDGTAALGPVEMVVRVRRDGVGNWQLEIDDDLNGVFDVQGNTLDATYTNSRYFGLVCDYTSSRVNLFTFDDFIVSGIPSRDTVPPSILSSNILSASSLDLKFSEKVISASLVPNNFDFLGDTNQILSVTYSGIDSSRVRLNVSDLINGKNYQIQVQNIADDSNNVMVADTVVLFYFIPDSSSYRDIVINEFYANPSNSNGLPDADFVELYNASDKTFELKDWEIADNVGFAIIDSYLLKPKEYLILTANSSVSDYQNYGSVLGLSSFPNFNNSDDAIVLRNEAGLIIDQINYDLSWYQDDSKDGGGWSIEQINPLNPCGGKTNFRASNAGIGGTPGSVNSVLDTIPIQTPLLIENVTVFSEDSFVIYFNKSLNQFLIDSVDFFLGGNTLSINSRSYNSQLQSINLTSSSPLDSGKIYELAIRNITDCSGSTFNLIARLVLPYTAQKGDIVINEILFNPVAGGVDFVELYNTTDKILSLKNWLIANGDENGVNSTEIISELPFFINRKAYLGLTEDLTALKATKPQTLSANFIELSNLPSYADNEGSVYLLNDRANIQDQLNYIDDMHFELLRDDEGVSLERLNPLLPANQEGNFRSAAETAGFATPGYQNSQFYERIAFSAKIEVEPETFSPDNDGYQDQLGINYQFQSPSNILNITIYDRYGRSIKKLVNNVSVQNEGTFFWNGLDDNGDKARIGIYMIYVEVFNAEGEKEIIKKTCVLAGLLD